MAFTYGQKAKSGGAAGLGGVGKTQLSIRFAKCYHENYSSVIWLNAKDENAVKAVYISLALRILGEEERESEIKQPDEEQAVRYV
jgi:MinD superfamily P-loop ATPase